MRTPYVFNIQRFSINDGPGLRTTIFFKGCPLRCPWCHNPESQAFGPETMTLPEGGSESVGKQYSVDELVAEANADLMFYDQSGGGVTLSGGESMAMDSDYILALVEALQGKGISVGIDTCGVAATKAFERVLPFTDFFLYDLKFIDDDAHKRWTGASNALVKQNLTMLSQQGARIYLRMVLLSGLNTSPDTIEATMLWLKTQRIDLAEINLLPYHRLGMDKFRKLGREPSTFTTPSDEELERIRTQVLRYYPAVTIGG
jgi:pyruvate formate lyase activating enzyme